MSALDRAAALITARYQPVNDSHAPEWAPKEKGGQYIGVSTLVKGTAREYAQRIVDEQWDEQDEEGAYYTFRGNALGDRALADFPHREIEVEVPLLKEWVLRGHADGVLVDGDDVAVAEHKSHASASVSKVDLAFRQGAAYLALMEHASITLPDKTRGRRLTPDGQEVQLPPSHLFPVARFSRDQTSMPFIWTENLAWEGVVVGVAPFNPPAAIKKFPLDAGARKEVLDFFLAKAKAVLACRLAEPGPKRFDTADKWDADHPTEFLMPFGDIGGGVPELDDVCRQLAEQLRVTTPQGIDPDVLEEAENEIKRLRKLADLSMEKCKVRSGVFAGVRISRTVVKGHEVAAKEAGWQDGYSYVKIKLADPVRMNRQTSLV